MSQNPDQSSPPDFSPQKDRIRPQQAGGFSVFPVADELVLLPDDGDALHALNKTSAAIYRLCDGAHTLGDMFKELRHSFSGEDLQIVTDLNEALLRFRELALIDTNISKSPRRPV